MCYPHVLFFWRAHCFSFPRKKSHVRTSERIVFARPLPSPYASLLCVTDAFRVTWSEKAFGCLPAVHLGYVTGMHWPRRPGKTPYRDQANPSTRIRFWLAIAKHWILRNRSHSICFALPSLFGSFWAIHRLSLTHLLRSCPWVISWTLTLWFIISYHRLIRSFSLSSCGDNNDKRMPFTCSTKLNMPFPNCP